MKNPNSICIFGGAFNPFHLGHLAIIKAIEKLPEIQKIWLIPTYISPQKEDQSENLNCFHRIEMLKRVVQEEKSCELNLIEIKKNTISYSIDTIKSLKKENKNTTFYSVIGSDNFFIFHQWKDYQALLKQVKLIIVNRSDISEKMYEKYIQKNLANYELKDFLMITINPIPIASNEIREKITRKEDVTNLVPNYINQYIVENNLYQS